MSAYPVRFDCQKVEVSSSAPQEGDSIELTPSLQVAFFPAAKLTAVTGAKQYKKTKI